MRWAKATAGIALIFLAVVFVEHHHGDSIRNFFSNGDAQEQSTIFIDEIPVRVTVADSPEKRTQGLSGKESLKNGEGMLFIFETESTPGFWMKDMRFAIDIIWISSRNEIVDIDMAVGPETYPKTFAPMEPVKTVLEVPAGFTDANNIKIGSKVDLEMIY